MENESSKGCIVGIKNPVLQSMGPQVYCEMKVDRGEGPTYVHVKLVPHHENLIFLGTNGNFTDCHGP